MSEPRTWTTQEIIEKIQSEGGMQDAMLYGVADFKTESFEVRNILQMAKAAAWTLDWAYDRLEQIAYDEECELVRQGK